MYHEDFLDSNIGLQARQLLLNGNVDIFENTSILEEWIQQINGFINCDNIIN
jgi:hypothetical protein